MKQNGRTLKEHDIPLNYFQVLEQKVYNNGDYNFPYQENISPCRSKHFKIRVHKTLRMISFDARV